MVAEKLVELVLTALELLDHRVERLDAPEPLRRNILDGLLQALAAPCNRVNR